MNSAYESLTSSSCSSNSTLSNSEIFSLSLSLPDPDRNQPFEHDGTDSGNVSLASSSCSFNSMPSNLESNFPSEPPNLIQPYPDRHHSFEHYGTDSGNESLEERLHSIYSNDLNTTVATHFSKNKDRIWIQKLNNSLTNFTSIFINCHTALSTQRKTIPEEETQKITQKYLETTAENCCENESNIEKTESNEDRRKVNDVRQQMIADLERKGVIEASGNEEVNEDEPSFDGEFNNDEMEHLMVTIGHDNLDEICKTSSWNDSGFYIESQAIDNTFFEKINELEKLEVIEKSVTSGKQSQILGNLEEIKQELEERKEQLDGRWSGRNVIKMRERRRFLFLLRESLDKVSTCDDLLELNNKYLKPMLSIPFIRRQITEPKQSLSGNTRKDADMKKRENEALEALENYRAKSESQDDPIVIQLKKKYQICVEKRRNAVQKRRNYEEKKQEKRRVYETMKNAEYRTESLIELAKEKMDQHQFDGLLSDILALERYMKSSIFLPLETEGSKDKEMSNVTKFRNLEKQYFAACEEETRIFETFIQIIEKTLNICGRKGKSHENETDSLPSGNYNYLSDILKRRETETQEIPNDHFENVNKQQKPQNRPGRPRSNLEELINYKEKLISELQISEKVFPIKKRHEIRVQIKEAKKDLQRIKNGLLKRKRYEKNKKSRNYGTLQKQKLEIVDQDTENVKESLMKEPKDKFNVFSQMNINVTPKMNTEQKRATYHNDSFIDNNNIHSSASNQKNKFWNYWKDEKLPSQIMIWIWIPFLKIMAFKKNVKRGTGRTRKYLEGDIESFRKNIEELHQEIKERQKSGLPPDERLTQELVEAKKEVVRAKNALSKRKKGNKEKKHEEWEKNTTINAITFGNVQVSKANLIGQIMMKIRIMAICAIFIILKIKNIYETKKAFRLKIIEIIEYNLATYRAKKEQGDQEKSKTQSDISHEQMIITALDLRKAYCQESTEGPFERQKENKIVTGTTEGPRKDIQVPIVSGSVSRNCVETPENNGVGRPRDDLEERIRNAEEEIKKLNKKIEDRQKSGLPPDERLTQQLMKAKKERQRARNASNKRKGYEKKRHNEPETERRLNTVFSNSQFFQGPSDIYPSDIDYHHLSVLYNPDYNYASSSAFPPLSYDQFEQQRSHKTKNSVTDVCTSSMIETEGNVQWFPTHQHGHTSVYPSSSFHRTPFLSYSPDTYKYKN